MILCIDIGNSNIVFGGFRGSELVFSSRVSTDRSRMSDQYAIDLVSLLSLYNVDSFEIDGAIISSVVPPLTGAVAAAVKRAVGVEPLILSQTLKTGLVVSGPNPGQLGCDLISDAVCAKAKYPLPAIVIDMGTATTLSALDADGTYLGVAIMPGLRVSLDALVSRTSALTGISLEAPETVIGTTTEQCMKSGIIFGASSAIDGMCERISRELCAKNITVIATGGLSSVVVPHCKTEIIRDEFLLIEGLRLIYEMNHD